MIIVGRALQINNEKGSYWNNIFFLASGNSIAQIIGVLTMPILTRLYSPEIFAIQVIFIQLVAFIAAFITFRFEYFLQLLSDKKESYSFILFILYIGFIMTILITIAIFIFNITNGLGYFKAGLSSFYYLAPVTAYFVCISIAIQHEAERRGNFKNTSLAAMVSKIFYVSAGIILSIVSNGIGLILTTLFGAVGKIFTLRKYFFSFFSDIKNINIDKRLVSRYVSRSKGLVISNTILSVSGLLPIMFITKNYGSNSLGQFSLVLATIYLPSGLIGSAVGNVFYQRAAVLFNRLEYLELRELWSDTIKKLLIFAIPIYLIIYLISPWVYPIVFGNSWYKAGSFAQLMAFSAFFSFLAGPLDRLSLVIGIGYYLPLIHIIRLLMVIFVVMVSTNLKLEEYGFVFLFSVGMSLVYLLDILLCRFYLFNKKVV